jgi:hypothetical protein
MGIQKTMGIIKERAGRCGVLRGKCGTWWQAGRGPKKGPPLEARLVLIDL